jgi:hypothetical protein
VGDGCVSGGACPNPDVADIANGIGGCSVRFEACGRSGKYVVALTSVAAGFLSLLGCAPFRPAFSETIVQGREFAHYVRFPSDFQPPKSVQGYVYLEHLGFRIAASSPDVLVAAACGYGDDSNEICSSNAFLIDTTHQYAVKTATSDEWERAVRVPGANSLRNPVGYALPYRLSMVDAKGTPVVPEELLGLDTPGWNFRDKNYFRRNDSITSLILGASGNGRLVLLAGVDKRKLPEKGLLFGSAVSDGLYGNFTIDAFDSDPARRIAAVDMDCDRASLGCMAAVTVINSRWFAIALATNLTKAVLFDFEPDREKDSK